MIIKKQEKCWKILSKLTKESGNMAFLILLCFVKSLDILLFVLVVYYDMEIVITTEEKWFSASIEKLHIHTQWDSFDELLVNISECIELYYFLV